MNIDERRVVAKSVYSVGMENIKKNPEPKGQKFPCGTRVHICKYLGGGMSHFKSDCNATVKYVYAHAYGGDNVEYYCLDVDNIGSVAWYKEWQLTAI